MVEDELKLTISLVSTNNRELTRACLASLYDRQVDHEVQFEVILVDNVSTDGTAEMVRVEFPKVQLIENGTRRGFGANHNQALRHARGQYVLVLNEDTVVRAGALSALCSVLEAEPDVGAVGPRLENPDGSLQRSCYRFPSPARAVAENLLLVAAFPNNQVWGDYRAWQHDARQDVEFVSGAAIMVRRAVIDTVGMFDERFLIYSEETDWCYRMRKAGWRVAFTPEGTIVHYGGQSSIKVKDRQFCEFHRSGEVYIRKHHGFFGLTVYRLSMIVGSVVRIPLWSAVYTVAKGQRQAAAKQVSLWLKILTWTLGARGPGLAPVKSGRR